VYRYIRTDPGFCLGGGTSTVVKVQSAKCEAQGILRLNLVAAELIKTHWFIDDKLKISERGGQASIHPLPKFAK